MSVLVQNLSDFFKLLIQAFNLSAILPAIIFNTLVLVFLIPIAPESLQFYKNWSPTVQLTGLTISVSVIAYILDAVNYTLIRLLEGYYPYPTKEVQSRINKEYVQSIRNRIFQIDQTTEELLPKAKANPGGEAERLVRELDQHNGVLVKLIARNYPEDPNLAMPTPFGNVIRAAEYYPKKRLGMDAIALWPFLTPILTKNEYAQFIIRQKAMMDFLINSLAIIWVFIPIFLFVEVKFQRTITPIAGFQISFLLFTALFLYIISIQSAASWGISIRTAFILFKDELRQSLKLRKPYNYEDEKLLWEFTSSFLRTEPMSEAQLTKWADKIFDTEGYQRPILYKE